MEKRKVLSIAVFELLSNIFGDTTGGLTGPEESVAVDRHIYKFISDAGIIYKDYKEVKQIVEYAADMMQISRRTLDYSIWLYMSNKKRAVQLELCFE